MNNILHIDASGRKTASVSRRLSNEIVQEISNDQSTVVYRDVSQGLPFVDEMMIGAYFTQSDERSEEQHQAIAISDTIVEELKAADTIVIGLPVYNFSMPAGFKAWSDLAARVGEINREVKCEFERELDSRADSVAATPHGLPRRGVAALGESSHRSELHARRTGHLQQRRRALWRWLRGRVSGRTA